VEWISLTQDIMEWGVSMYMVVNLLQKVRRAFNSLRDYKLLKDSATWN